MYLPGCNLAEDNSVSHFTATSCRVNRDNLIIHKR